MTNTSIRKEFANYCTTDNFSAPPYETDIISDWWLSKLTSELKDLSEQVERERASKHLYGSMFTNWKTYNKALDTVLQLIANKINK